MVRGVMYEKGFKNMRYDFDLATDKLYYSTPGLLIIPSSMEKPSAGNVKPLKARRKTCV